MSQHKVIIKDLRERAESLESKAEAYGEDMGAPYRDAAEKVREVAHAYERTTPMNTDTDN